MAFAFGINLAVSKLGSVVNNIVSPLLTEKIGIVFAFWFGTILCGFSIFCVLLTIPIDKAMDNRIARWKLEGLYILTAGNDETGADSMEKTSAFNFSDSGDDLRENDKERDEAGSLLSNTTLQAEEVTWKDVFKLTHIFWVLVVSCVVVYGCILPFNNISSSLLLERDYFVTPPGEGLQAVSSICGYNGVVLCL